MKAGTTDKIKFKRLRQSLGLPDWQLIGLLESIWQAAYANAPAGDLGRLSNADIATAIGWTDDADSLINALVVTGWLDADPTHRLLVHDWEEHCASWLRANFKRHNKEFAKPTTQLAVHGAAEVAQHPTLQATVQPAQQPTAKLPPYHTKPNHTKPRETTVSQRGCVFRKPTFAEVAEYCRERNNGIGAQEFLDHYEANGWKRGNTPIKDWRACIRTWEAKRRKEHPASRVVTSEEFAEMQRNGFNLSTGEASR